MTSSASRVLADSTPPLRGRGALVTGGSRGIGRAVVRRLAADGATVAFTYHTHATDAERLAAEIGTAGGLAFALPLDVADPEQFPSTFAAVGDAFRRAGIDGLDVVVANAGVFSSAVIADATVDEWDRVMAINARGAFLTTPTRHVPATRQRAHHHPVDHRHAMAQPGRGHLRGQ